jgi:FkbM family methyltransferase
LWAAARAAAPAAASGCGADSAQVAALRAELAAAREGVAGASAAAVAAPGRVGLQRLLTDAELDEMFRIRSELDSQHMGTADAEMLLPYFAFIYGEHQRQRGRGLSGAGGFVDVGANVGDVSEGILATLSDHARRFYVHGLDPPGGALPKLVDPVHPMYESGKMPFLYALEPAEATRALLERRALMGAWAVSNFRVFPLAATATTGTATFCAHNSGSGQSALAGSENGGIFGDAKGKDVAALQGEVRCSSIETVALADLLDERGDITKGHGARVFLLKVDVEGAEAVVLAGAAPLFAAKRVSYVLFENHAKWRASQEAIGMKVFVSVGDVVQQLVAFGYRCAYVSPWGLLPFETPGTPSGDKAFPGCKEGLPACARHRLYNRQVWVRYV